MSEDRAALLAMPKRIQRQRTKGWQMPPNTVYVGRPGPWGNPFKIGEDCLWAANLKGIVYLRPKDAAEAVANYRTFVSFYLRINDGRFEYRNISDLRGKDLACWCPLDQPCHADVLLELANA